MTLYDPLAIITDLYHATDASGIITIPFMHNMQVLMDWDGKDCRRVKEQFAILYKFLNEMTTWTFFLTDSEEENSHILPSYEYKMWKKWLSPFDLSSFNRTVLHTIHMKKLNHTPLTSVEEVLNGAYRKELNRQAVQRIGPGLFSAELIRYAILAVQKGTDGECNSSVAESLAILYAIHTCGVKIV